MVYVTIRHNCFDNVLEAACVSQYDPICAKGLSHNTFTVLSTLASMLRGGYNKSRIQQEEEITRIRPANI